MLKTALLPVIALALAGLAPAPAQPVAGEGDERPARACFAPQTVVNYRTDGDTTAYVRTGRGEVFQLQSSGCRGLGMSRGLGIAPESGMGACVGETIGLATSGPSLMGENNSRCTARVVKHLTAEEVAALPGRVRP